MARLAILLLLACLATGGCRSSEPMPTLEAVRASTQPFAETFGDPGKEDSLARYAAARTVLITRESSLRAMSADEPIDAELGRELGWSSGVIVSPDGYVLASSHGTLDPDLAVLLPDWNRRGIIQARRATVVWRRSEGERLGDLALLKIELAGTDEPLAYVDSERLSTAPPRPGQAVLLTGTPYVDTIFPPPLTQSAGRITQVREVALIGHDVRVDAPSRRGFSGGPAFTEDGHFAGILTRLNWSRHLRFRGLLPGTTTTFTADLVRPDFRLLEGSIGKSATLQ